MSNPSKIFIRRQPIKQPHGRLYEIVTDKANGTQSVGVTSHSLLQLQRLYGNYFIQRFMRKSERGGRSLVWQSALRRKAVRATGAGKKGIEGATQEKWQDTPEQKAFLEAVLQAHLARSRRGRQPLPDLGGDELKPVVGTGVHMRTEAASAASRLLADATQALAAAKQAGDKDALATIKLSATSGYRGRAKQESLWREYFMRPKGYYNRTAAHRASLSGGAHGDAAITYMVKYVSPKIAAPGFSNHQAGLAIDLWQTRTKENAIANSTDSTAVRKWQRTWFFAWLQANAGQYQFAEYAKEPWHWTYTGKVGAAGAQPAAAGGSSPTASAAPPESKTTAETAPPEAEGWLEKAVVHNVELGSHLGWLNRLDEIVAHFQKLGYLPRLQTPTAQVFAAAVKQYQLAHRSLGSDGILGRHTWRQLQADLGQGKKDVSKSTQATDMSAAARIDLGGLRDLDRTMASIHNDYGSFLENASKELGIDIADAAAFLQVESRGQGFSPQTHKMIIRFENHLFYRFWGEHNPEQFADHFHFNAKKRQWLGHKFRADSKGKFEKVHSSQNREWAVFEFARTLDEESAIKSISMGAAQILGSNYRMLGYESAKEMFADMSGTLQVQIEGLFTYIKKRNKGVIIKALKAKDYTLAARYYNGSGQALLYGSKLKEASNAYTRVVGQRLRQ